MFASSYGNRAAVPDVILQNHFGRPPTNSTQYTGRTSSTSSSSAGVSPKRSRGLESEIESWDSGAEGSQCDALPRHGLSYSPSDSPPLTRQRLDQWAVDYAVRLRALVASVDFFRQLANRECNASDDLLEELKRKLKPRLLALDDDVMETADLIKIDIDRCRITDNRLTMLLAYNELLQGIHSQLEKLLTKVLDELEHRLKILERGAFDNPARHHAVQRAISDIVEAANGLESKARDEASHNRQNYSPTSARTISSGSSRTSITK